MELYNKNGKTLWAFAIAKDMYSIRFYFDIRGKEYNYPPGHQFIKCNIILDVKMEDIQCKAGLLDGGHMTDVLLKITYASVIYRETVRIDWTMMTLNGMSIKTADTINAYIKATCGENRYTNTILGLEFELDKGNMEIVIRALYGLKSAGASFRNHLAECMQFM